MYTDSNGNNITERGWPGHFCCASRCLFRRNTLIEASNIRKIIVSTVGNMTSYPEGKSEPIGLTRYFETMTFHATQQGAYLDANVHNEIHNGFRSGPDYVGNSTDNVANDMHEECVSDMSSRLAAQTDAEFLAQFDRTLDDDGA